MVSFLFAFHPKQRDDFILVTQHGDKEIQEVEDDYKFKIEIVSITMAGGYHRLHNTLA